MAWAQGDYEQAIQKFEAALAVSQEAGDKFGIVLALYGLGRVAQSQGDYATAHSLHMEAIVICQEISDRGIAAFHLEAFASLATAQKHIDHAARLFGAAETLYAGLRFEMSAKERAEHDETITTARAALGEETFTAVYEEGKKMTLDEAVEYALNES